MDSLVVKLSIYISLFIFMSTMLCASIFDFINKEKISSFIAALVVSMPQVLILILIINILMEILK